MGAALDAGAEDFKTTDSTYEIVTAPEKFAQIRQHLLDKGLLPQSAEQVRLPKSTVPLDGKNAQLMVRLLEVLEDHDDVQNVYANFDIADSLLENLVESNPS